jgi:hypothetical protein
MRAIFRVLHEAGGVDVGRRSFRHQLCLPGTVCSSHELAAEGEHIMSSNYQDPNQQDPNQGQWGQQQGQGGQYGNQQGNQGF